MKLITFSYSIGGDFRTGLLGKGGTLHDITGEYGSMNTLIEGCKDIAPLGYLAELEGEFSLEQVHLAAPIPRPMQDIICLGINYAEHAKESAKFKKETFERDRKYPVYFSKRVNEALPHGGKITIDPQLDEAIDYEAELAVIIGKDAYRVSPRDAESYIFGYTLINDLSARTLQSRHKQWYFGKSLNGFAPMGPYIVTKEEIPFPPALSIKSYVNGELRQSSNTALMLFDISYIIADLSRGMTLKAGTIISTGTPAGAGMGFDPPKFLKKGDQVTCEAEKIGILTTYVDSEVF